MQSKVVEGNWKCYFSEHRNNKKVTEPYYWYRESFSSLDRSNHPQHSLKPSWSQSKSLTLFNCIKVVRATEDKFEASRSWFMKSHMVLFAQRNKDLLPLFLYSVHCFVDSLVSLIWYLQGNYLQTLKSVLKVIKWIFESLI